MPIHPLIHSRRATGAAIAASGLATFALASCGTTKAANSPAPVNAAAVAPTTMAMPATTKPSGPAVATSQVNIKNFGFSPATITVKAGTTVTWTNSDEEPHTVVSSSASLKSATLIGASNTYSHAFMTPGTYAYNCSIHPFMQGTVVVTA